MSTNFDRARWADHARDQYLKGKKEQPDATIEADCVDLITDLLHLLHQQGFDAEALLGVAERNFKTDILEEQSDQS